MSYNSLATDNIMTIISSTEIRANRLEAMIQGTPIDTVRIGTAIITTAKIDDLSITNAKINTGAITTAKIDSLSAVKVTADTINASRIAVSSITADKLNVSTLSAISASFGTVTAGSITGLTITAPNIRTSNGADRIAMGGGQMEMYDSTSALIIISGPSDGAFFGGAGIGFVETGGSTSTFRGTAGTSSTTGNFIYGTQNSDLLLFQALGTGDVLVETNNGDIYVSCNTFKINGNTKTAIVPTNNGYNALYCVESPDVWFFDIIKSTDDIDPMFLEVTEGDYKTITNKNGEVLIFRKRRGYSKLRFENKSLDEFNKNNTLWDHQYEN